MSSAVETSPQTFLLSLPKALQVACRTAGTVKSVEEVVALTEEPKIFKLQKVDREATYKVVGRILLKMVKDMNLPNGLSSDNLRTIAKRLTDDEDVRYWLTLADISLLCRRIAEGYYGKTYGHFGLAEFNECLIAYCNERTECHRVQNTKTVVDVKAVQESVGYTIDKEGRLVVPEENQGVKNSRPQRYLYDEQGNIKGENPAYFKNVKSKEKTPEEIERINLFNRRLERAKELQSENDKLPFYAAFAKAELEIKSL